MFEWLKNIFNPTPPDQDNVIDQHKPDDEDDQLDRYAKGSPADDSPHGEHHDGGDDGGD
ncbi:MULTISPECIES: hypothetical protein [Photobacterium]|uniref:hypothetical protein n=1 Tax=Photobacterium TaxID=657 RepID=UPI000AA856CA|nr:MULTISPECIES: hypothetical protein [Photobacterium]WEM45650.1 hypothetical protein PTW35_21500 [Photobacterium sp. DA100]